MYSHSYNVSIEIYVLNMWILVNMSLNSRNTWINLLDVTLNDFIFSLFCMKSTIYLVLKSQFNDESCGLFLKPAFCWQQKLQGEMDLPTNQHPHSIPYYLKRNNANIGFSRWKQKFRQQNISFSESWSTVLCFQVRPSHFYSNSVLVVLCSCTTWFLDFEWFS